MTANQILFRCPLYKFLKKYSWYVHVCPIIRTSEKLSGDVPQL